jgi:hypothetical protein
VGPDPGQAATPDHALGHRLEPNVTQFDRGRPSKRRSQDHQRTRLLAAVKRQLPQSGLAATARATGTLGAGMGSLGCVFGHDWQRATGTVVDFRAVGTGKNSASALHDFVVDVRLADGTVFRAEVQQPRNSIDFRMPYPGATVGVEVDAKSRSVRFDKADPRLSIKAHRRVEQSEFDATLGEPPASPSRPVDRIRDQRPVPPRADTSVEDLRRKLEERGIVPPGDEGG